MAPRLRAGPSPCAVYLWEPIAASAPGLSAMISDPITALPRVQAGTIKAYGVTPDVPNAGEVGLPGFDISQWHGLWLPKGAPKNISSPD